MMISILDTLASRSLIGALALSAGAALAAPDLSISGVLEDPQADPGDRITVDFTIFNSGDQDANEPAVGYYFSSDPLVSGDDAFLEKDEVSDIDAGEGESESEQLTVPGVPDGEYFVLVFADPYDTIAEDDETNNVRAFPITVGDPGAIDCPADLTGDGIADLEDVQAFVSAFLLGDLSVDQNDDGVLDLADAQAFITLFTAGCP